MENNNTVLKMIMEDANDKAKSPFHVVMGGTIKEGETPLSLVVGHDKQKEELLNLIKWFKNSKELKEKGVSIPKGVLLTGPQGNGKSLLIKEIIKCCDAPVFIFNGKGSDIVSDISTTFKRAKMVGHAVIVIDELDLLIDKERRVARVLQECLDGVETDDDILVLSATNNINDIPTPLLRNGRLEKIIGIPYPKGDESLALLKKHFKEFNVELPEDLDEEETALSLNGISCAGIKAVANDVVLRNGFKDITTEMIDNSIYRISERVITAPENDNIQVSIHEAGHCIVAQRYPEYFKVNRLSIKGASGQFNAKELQTSFWPYEKIIADIKISMAGNLAEKIICKSGSRGADEDLQRARIDAYNMVTQNGYSSCWETLPKIRQTSRVETQVKRRKMEKKIEHLLKRCEKDTIKYIKKHASEIKKLGQLLYEKKHLKSSEILSCIG